MRDVSGKFGFINEEGQGYFLLIVGIASFLSIIYSLNSDRGFIIVTSRFPSKILTPKRKLLEILTIFCCVFVFNHKQHFVKSHLISPSAEEFISVKISLLLFLICRNSLDSSDRLRRSGIDNLYTNFH